MKVLACGLAVLAVAISTPGAASAQQPHPDLSGQWVFDSAKSDRPITPIERGSYGLGRPAPADSEGGERGGVGEPMERPGEMSGMDGMGGRSGYRRGRESPDEKDRARMRLMLRLAQPDSALAIYRTDSTVTVVTPADSLILFTDGRKMKDTLGANVEVETKAEWKDDALVVERKLGGDLKITERFTLSGTGRYLWLYVQADNGRFHMPVPFLRVYYHPGEEP